MNIFKNPKNNNPLYYDKSTHSFVDSITKEVFKINQHGIIEFIKTSEITGDNEKSTKFYNSFSPFYELGQKLWYSFFGGEKKARNDYLQYLNIQPNNLVLEVSVGTSANIKYLPQSAFYYGIDISIGQLLQSWKNKKKYHLPIKLCWGNAEMLPFHDDSFDCVFHVGGINLFNNKKKAINELIRVAKPGTSIMICDETEKVAAAYEKLPYFGKPFRVEKKQ
jgi:Methylase involved in ubiquinone/menaquinone biosynthesis